MDHDLGRAAQRLWPDLLWDFRVTCFREPLDSEHKGQYRVRLVGGVTGEVRESVGYHPLWELIRLIGFKSAQRKDGGA